MLTNYCRSLLGLRNEPERTRLEKLPCREISGWGKSLHATPVFRIDVLSLDVEEMLRPEEDSLGKPKCYHYTAPSGELRHE